MAGNKAHDLEIRTIEHKEGPNVPAGGGDAGAGAKHPERPHPHQESRDHHKHNNPGQDGHKPQKHSPAEEKH